MAESLTSAPALPVITVLELRWLLDTLSSAPSTVGQVHTRKDFLDRITELANCQFPIGAIVPVAAAPEQEPTSVLSPG